LRQEFGGQIDKGILTNVGPRLRTTGATSYELDDGARGGMIAFDLLQDNDGDGD
jgi:hypothetical protein